MYKPCLKPKTIYVIRGIGNPYAQISSAMHQGVIYAYATSETEQPAINTNTLVALGYCPIVTTEHGLHTLRANQGGDRVLKQYSVMAYPSEHPSRYEVSFCGGEIPN